MTDVLILYEHRAREIENCALLILELERRGFKVKLKSIFSPFKYFVKSKVVIVPHLYNENQLIGFCKNFWKSNKCIIDLQYEQMLAKNVPLNDIHYPKGQAVYAEHIAWGQAQVDRYLACGIDPSHIHKTGAISMDLLRPEFNRYFLSREEIGDIFSLDLNKKWYLFVSSFALMNRTEEEIDKYQEDDPNIRTFKEITEKTYNIFICCIRKACSENPDKLFIYRPHPAERPDNQLIKLETEFPNFRRIGDMSMRQWAKVSDKIYNWYSTSMSDIYFAGKPCGLFRPIPFPSGLDMDIFDGLHRIETEAEFLNSLEDMSLLSEIAVNKIVYGFGNGKGRMAYLQTVDICESFITGELKGHDYDYGKSRFSFTNKESKIIIMKEYLYIPFYCLVNLFNIENMPLLPERWRLLLKRFKNDNYGVNDELKQYKERFAKVLKVAKS